MTKSFFGAKLVIAKIFVPSLLGIFIFPHYFILISGDISASHENKMFTINILSRRKFLEEVA